MRLRWISMTLLLAPIACVAQKAAQDADLKRAAKLVVEQTNAFRGEHDLPAVEVDDGLMKAAQDFADFMARTGKYGHRADGGTPAERATAAGYDYCVVRENIAYRSDTNDHDAEFLGDYFTQAWIDSPEHRENMLADYITQTGVAMATTEGVTYYAVQLFGRPKSAAYEITVTNETSETWTLRAESGGGADEMELSPRLVVRLTRCLPTTLSLVGADTRQEFRESSETTIATQDGKPVFRAQTR